MHAYESKAIIHNFVGAEAKLANSEDVDVLAGIEGKDSSLWWSAFWVLMVIAFATRFYQVRF